MKNEDLVQAFLALMARAGKPLERVTTRRRGAPDQTYRMPDGRTVRLRTNRKQAVMVLAKDGTVEAALPFEGEDFLGAVFQRDDKAVGYLIPSAVAAKEYREVHSKWLAQEPLLKKRSQENLTRVLKFEDQPEGSRAVNYGCARKFRKYLLGEIELTPRVAEMPAPPPGLLTRYRQQIAADLGVPEWAVSISINLGPPPAK